MSLILDALRKSERARQQSLTGQLGSAETPSGPGRLPVPWVPLLAGLLIANAVLLFVFWPRSPEPVRADTPVAAAPAPAYHPSVRPLADEAGDDAAAAPAQPQGSSTDLSPSAQPAQAVAANPPLPTSTTDTSSLPTFDALTPEQRQSLPALHMDVHGYVGNPKGRFVVINLKQYHIGDVLDEGPTLKDILPQGAVLEFHGTTFLLPSY
jgi:general secretion pathway protein B